MNLGMMTKEYDRMIQEQIKKVWWIKAFYNEQIGTYENRLGHELGLRFNAAAKINTSIAEWLIEKRKITRDIVCYEIKTEDVNEIRQWCREIKKYNKAMGWIAKKLDLEVHEINIRALGTRKVTCIEYRTKDYDEGFEGGICNIKYERERLREEWKVQKARQNKL